MLQKNKTNGIDSLYYCLKGWRRVILLVEKQLDRYIFISSENSQALDILVVDIEEIYDLIYWVAFLVLQLRL